MRIISQDGYGYDIPYEKMILCVEGSVIAAYGTQNIDDGARAVIARYSTSEKTRMAMEMLRRAYTGIALNTTEPMNAYFRFPDEDEDLEEERDG